MRTAAFLFMFVALLVAVTTVAWADTILTFTICNADKCEERKIDFSDAGLMACIKFGQPSAIKWMEENKPGLWAIKRLRCGPSEKGA